VAMWVDPAHRGSDAATRLVEAVCRWADDDGGRVVSLWVADGNDRARRFYERLGFTGTGERQPLPSAPEVGEERFVLHLA
jgi:ribosomal protein S18 acetylase RimI-like enzyme